MKFLDYRESVAWCARRKIPTRQREGYIVGPEPDLESPTFHFANFLPPVDSGKKVWFAKFLYLLIEPSPELLIWLGNWAVWPSSQHMPLFARFRQSFGETRPLIETPGHLLTPGEADDAISILNVSLLFVWDCHVLAASGREAVFVSHDEYGWFASRDASVATAVGERLAKALEP